MLSQLINTAKHDNVRIDALRLDGGTQPRQGINTAYVDELTASIVEGATLPPVEVIYDGTNYWLYDGFHRVAAHQAAGILIIGANIHQGTQADAQWRSYAANQTHGLRRTNDDKQRAIKAALRHPNGVTMANREIARHLGVDHKTVGDWREKLQATGEIPQSTQRTGADGRTINTTNIGTNQPPKPVNKYVPPIFVNELQAIVSRWAKEHWAGEWPENPSHTNGTFWRDITAWLHANDSRPWREGDLKAAIKEVHVRERTLAAKDAAEHSATPAITTREAADILRPIINEFYVNEENRRHRIPDMRAGAQSTTGGFWRACERTLSNYTYTAALLANAIRLLADELEELEPSTPSTPSTPETNAIRLTGFALRQRLVDHTITDAYNLPGSVSLVLDNGQTITINGTGLQFTVKEA